jgi:ribosome-binding ATPase YchF (GTP1/OBG family)
MNLSVGIVGLPNSGKSTLFNTLLKRQIANVASYPFTTIEPNVGVVEVPDERLKKLAGLLKPEKIVPATVKFIDIAGLVKNAHQGEGLGNQFLAKIREVDAVVEVIRAFKDESIPHFYGSIDVKRDKEMVDLELSLGEIKKPTLYVINSSDVNFQSSSGELVINAQSGERVDNLIKKAYELLGLITFYTIKGGKEITAWALKNGSKALEAAAKVHQDMAQGFIKAEVINFNDFVNIGDWQQTKNKGKVRLEGRDYVVKDGDIIEFKFNT